MTINWHAWDLLMHISTIWKQHIFPSNWALIPDLCAIFAHSFGGTSPLNWKTQQTCASKPSAYLFKTTLFFMSGLHDGSDLITIQNIINKKFWPHNPYRTICKTQVKFGTGGGVLNSKKCCWSESTGLQKLWNITTAMNCCHKDWLIMLATWTKAYSATDDDCPTATQSSAKHFPATATNFSCACPWHHLFPCPCPWEDSSETVQPPRKWADGFLYAQTARRKRSHSIWTLRTSANILPQFLAGEVLCSETHIHIRVSHQHCHHPLLLAVATLWETRSGVHASIEWQSPKYRLTMHADISNPDDSGHHATMYAATMASSSCPPGYSCHG